MARPAGHPVPETRALAHTSPPQAAAAAAGQGADADVVHWRCPECNAEPTDACPLPQCGDPGTGDCCFANGTPSCNDETCCDQVCNTDPVCCDVVWDSICAQEAADNCDICDSDLECGSTDAGLCSEPNSTPFCSDADCCETVCGIEPFCCIGAWDDFCVSLNDLFCTP